MCFFVIGMFIHVNISGEQKEMYGIVVENFYVCNFVLVQCEPFLLPKPNHVMLNHLYALSIKVSLLLFTTWHSMYGSGTM